MGDGKKEGEKKKITVIWLSMMLLIASGSIANLSKTSQNLCAPEHQENSARRVNSMSGILLAKQKHTLPPRQTANRGLDRIYA